MLDGIRIKARNVIIDVDDTITGFKEGCSAAPTDTFYDLLASMIVERENISFDEAVKKITDAPTGASGCISTALPALGIDGETYWNRVVECFKKQFRVFPGARIMIEKLHGAGFNLYSATTNSAFSISAKLAVGGLATYMHAPHFKAIAGGGEIHPAGKSCPEFFVSLLKKWNLNPDETVMVGDNPTIDCAYARQAGITHVILPRPSQNETVVMESDGGIYVRSLDIVPDMLELINQPG